MKRIIKATLFLILITSTCSVQSMPAAEQEESKLPYCIFPLLIFNAKDCNGVKHGTAYIDNCNACVGGNTGRVACVQDCNGDWGGTAYLDTCNNCVGGNTGNTPCPPVGVITSPNTGRIWMDRNLGASRVATSKTDEAAYGSLYQWGRLSDGHEERSSATTSETSDQDEPGHNMFITKNSWRVPHNPNLWQPDTGINNPCPAGFRVPTHDEFSAEASDISFLKLTVGGWRPFWSGSTDKVGNAGYYWSSTDNGDTASYMNIYTWSNQGQANQATNYGHGMSVRCIKEE